MKEEVKNKTENVYLSHAKTNNESLNISGSSQVKNNVSNR